MKKLLSIILAVIILMTTLPLPAAAKTGDESGGYYYRHLTDPVAKRVYEAIEKSWSQQSTTIPVQIKVTVPLSELNGYTRSTFGPVWDALQKQLEIGVACWRYDFVQKAELYSERYEVLLSYVVNDRTGEFLECEVEILLYAHPAYTPNIEMLRDTKLNLIAAEANKQPTVFAKLRSIHDQIAAMATYDYDAAKLTDDDNNKKEFFYAHSSLGILLTGTGVCESYAKLFKMVCDKLSLGECICLVSKTHTWNAVKIGGQWYAVDVTWDDQASDNKPIYTHFLSADPDVLDGNKTDHLVDTTYTVAPAYANDAYIDSSVSLVAPKVSVANDTAGLTVSWRGVNGANRYLIYRSVYASGKWSAPTLIKTTTSTTYTNTSVKNGSDYRYVVKAENVFVTGPGGTSLAIRRLTDPVGALANTTAGIKLTWKKNSAATGYRVYRATYNKGKLGNWQLLKTTKSTSYTDKKAKKGTDYRYALQAYSGTSFSDRTPSYTIRRLLSPTATLTNDEKSIKVSWKKSAGATGYKVYRATYSKSKLGKWKLVKTTKRSSYTDKSVKNGSRYRYKVYAYYGGSSSAEVTTAAIKRLSPTTAKVKKTSGGIKVTWSKNTSASGYYLYRRQYKNGKWSDWKKLGSTRKTAYTDKKAKKKVNYQYTVRGVSGSDISAVKASKKVKR